MECLGELLQDNQAGLVKTMTEWAHPAEGHSGEVVGFFEEHDYGAFWKERQIEDAAQKHVLGAWTRPGVATVELGGGFGRITKILETRFGTSVLVELSNRNIGMARKYLARSALTKADVAATPFRDSTFDCVVMVRVAHLLTDPTAVFREIHRIAKDGATVIVSIPNQAIINAFMVLGRILHFGREKRSEPGFIPSIWPYGNRSYILSPMAMFPTSFKLKGRKGTGTFENPIGRRLGGHSRFYLFDVATSSMWMFKFEIFLRFEVRKGEGGRSDSKATQDSPHHARA